jgi:glycosyltransferase involved in cell wall biosynthesis
MEKTDKSAEESFVKYLVVKFIKWVALFFFINEVCYGIHDPLNLKLHVGLFVFSFIPALFMLWGILRKYQQLLNNEMEECQNNIIILQDRLNALKAERQEETRPQRLLE